MRMISDNGISQVWFEDGWIFKRQPKSMTDNEIFALDRLRPSGIVPKAVQIEIELIRMDFIERDMIVSDPVSWIETILGSLAAAEIRHGDLTPPHVIFSGGRPYLLDWGESRHWWDPRPDKRPEGDQHWLTKTLVSLSQTTT